MSTTTPNAGSPRGAQRAVKPENAVEEAILGRRSIRGFLAEPIRIETVAHILDVAASAPSGSNIQPWKVHVLAGTALASLREELVDRFFAGEPERPEYAYYPLRWRTPYIERRRETGWSLYSLTGVERGDTEASRRQRARNYLFFDAPVGLVFTIDRDLERGSWLDFGMFLQNVMVAARARGLDTCPQQSIANYPDVVARRLGIPAEEMVVCGMALGIADPDEPANQLVTSRAGVRTFARFHTGTPYPGAEGDREADIDAAR